MIHITSRVMKKMEINHYTIYADNSFVIATKQKDRSQ